MLISSYLSSDKAVETFGMISSAEKVPPNGSTFGLVSLSGCVRCGQVGYFWLPSRQTVTDREVLDIVRMSYRCCLGLENAIQVVVFSIADP